MTIYYKKEEALSKKTENEIIYNRGCIEYYITENYEKLLKIILETEEEKRNFYEFIPSESPIPFFFDIEIYRNKNEELFENPELIINECYEIVKGYIQQNTIENVKIKKIILESHNEEKKSYHCVFRLYKDEKELLLNNVYALKKIVKKRDDKVIDISVYREGLFRTIHSTKGGEKRFLKRNERSDIFRDLETFLCYHSENYEIIKSSITITTLTETNEVILDFSQNEKEIIKKFIRKEYNISEKIIRDIIIDKKNNCIVISLSLKYCKFRNDEHKSNNQYIVIDTISAKQKCHDSECEDKKYNEIKIDKYPKEIYEIVKRKLKMTLMEMELIEKAKEECREYITENYDDKILDVIFDSSEMIFKSNVENRDLIRLIKGKCPECNVEHQISDNGYCLKCKICSTIFPKNHIIPLNPEYFHLKNFWINYTNNGTINNIINIYNNTDEFSCDIKLDLKIFNNKEITNILNQILDGHKITMISKLLHAIDKNFVYSKGSWYYFNSIYWKNDDDNIEMKKQIMDLSKLFDKINLYYENELKNDNLSKNIKSLINKLHRPGFQDDIIRGAKIFYNDEKFITLLNSKKHLIPFTNGVYDLLQNKFRTTTKDDYINYTVGYEYTTIPNSKVVWDFIISVLPNKGVREYVLKKLSECLNGDIPNTHFLMFIGDGANGKSQLLNLMNLAMGDFGDKVEVTLLTRKRNNANETNSEKIKLINKRFAFLSEPEDGEKINIGLLKELTGSEEIVARGLYQGSTSFIMEAKLFLACNELPEIKGEDTALWRRIRVIEFLSRFVDYPKEANEYKIDRTLPSKMRQELEWRQTFMNILIDYYYKENVKEPQEIQMKTNEYRDENNDFFAWLSENLEYNPQRAISLGEITEAYTSKKLPSRMSSKYKKEIEKWIKQTHKNIAYEYKDISFNGNRVRGWVGLAFKF